MLVIIVLIPERHMEGDLTDSSDAPLMFQPEP